MKSINGARNPGISDCATRRALIRWLELSPESVFLLEPRQFRELVAGLLADLGCDIQFEPTPCDRGVDIRACLNTTVGRVLCLVQAKKYRKDRPVGIDSVLKIYGALVDHSASLAMIVTTSSFSPDAHAFAARYQHQISLLDYRALVSRIRP